MHRREAKDFIQHAAHVLEYCEPYRKVSGAITSAVRLVSSLDNEAQKLIDENNKLRNEAVFFRPGFTFHSVVNEPTSFEPNFRSTWGNCNFADLEARTLSTLPNGTVLRDRHTHYKFWKNYAVRPTPTMRDEVERLEGCLRRAAIARDAALRELADVKKARDDALRALAEAARDRDNARLCLEADHRAAHQIDLQLQRVVEENRRYRKALVARIELTPATYVFNPPKVDVAAVNGHLQAIDNLVRNPK